MRSINRLERYVAPSIAAVTLALGASACRGESYATSPATDSRAYPGDPHAYGNDPYNWHEVVVADVQFQEPITNSDMIVGFEVPGSNDWHESKPMELDPTEPGSILLRIGPGPVEFRVQLQSKYSRYTKSAPNVIFKGPESYSRAIKNPDVRVPNGWQT